jgi:hypothetical protein
LKGIALADEPRRKPVEMILLTLGVVLLLGFLFVPLYLVHSYDTQHHGSTSQKRHLTEVTVGIATILRAAARRVFRAGARNVLRTTAGAFTRAAIRAITRRVIRLALHSVLAALGKSALPSARDEGDSTGGFWRMSSGPATLIGAVAVGASFAGVVLVIGRDTGEDPLGPFALSLWQAAVLSSIPLFLYALLATTLSPICGARARIGTEIEGLFIQAYFTGAGSFLPMTTDIHYVEGSPRQRARAAALTQVVFFVSFLLVFAAGEFSGIPALQFLAAMQLVYAFIFVFPIPPLDGYEVWCQSWLVWLGLFLPIFAAFLFCYPDELAILL